MNLTQFRGFIAESKKQLIVILSCIIVILILIIFLLGRPADYEKVKSQILITSLEFYAAGYQDYKNDRQLQTLDISKASEGDESLKIIITYWYEQYQEGYQDARDGLPSKIDKIRENINQQLEVLEKMQITTDEMLETVDSLKSNTNQILGIADQELKILKKLVKMEVTMLKTIDSLRVNLMSQ